MENQSARSNENSSQKASHEAIQITHKTVYYDRTPLILGAQRALVRPRECSDVHIESSLLEIEEQPDAHWIRDAFDRMEVTVKVVQV